MLGIMCLPFITVLTFVGRRRLSELHELSHVGIVKWVNVMQYLLERFCMWDCVSSPAGICYTIQHSRSLKLNKEWSQEVLSNPCDSVISFSFLNSFSGFYFDLHTNCFHELYKWIVHDRGEYFCHSSKQKKRKTSQDTYIFLSMLLEYEWHQDPRK